MTDLKYGDSKFKHTKKMGTREMFDFEQTKKNRVFLKEHKKPEVHIIIG
jgi:hypothetical protein